MKTSTATVIVNIAVMGSLLLGYEVGDEILVYRDGDQWKDHRGIFLPDECLSFEMTPHDPTSAHLAPWCSGRGS